jgi:hypothetical protein
MSGIPNTPQSRAHYFFLKIIKGTPSKTARRRITVTSSLKGQCHEIFASGFFHESPSPNPLIITVGSFRIFSKIRGDIRKSKFTTSVNDTGGKFSTGINDTGGKFATGVVDTGGK